MTEIGRNMPLLHESELDREERDRMARLAAKQALRANRLPKTALSKKEKTDLLVRAGLRQQR